MRHLSTLLVLLVVLSVQTQAKIWRINNNVGIAADFTTFTAAVQASTVANGDTLYVEASANEYTTNSITINKRLVIIGMGYFLNPDDTNNPANTGLQASNYGSPLQYISFGEGSAGSKVLGMSLTYVYINSSTVPINILFERCLFYSNGLIFDNSTHNGVTVRKCFFLSTGISATSGSVTNFVCENNIFYGYWGGVNMPALTGSTNVFRNNSIKDAATGSTLVNCYVANNIFGTFNTHSFTNCTVKNNFFSANQTLSGTASNNQVNVNMADVYVGGTTGSQDSRTMLKSGSPAIAAGVTVGSVTTPDCGAFGATDPYRLSGIPNIPTIYSLTVPVSIPSGSPTMNITFSTRNNN